MTIRIAMWSGPRNISTALMRSWENRPDCSVIDEPFYACYLLETGLQHPCREAILAAQPTERAEVVRRLIQDEPAQDEPATAIVYQKHMTHHIPRGADLGWCADLRHAFLIRQPAEVIASYLGKMPEATEEGIGIVRQREIYEEIAALTGNPPAVIDSGDVLQDPAGILRQLCERLEVPFTEAMLRWPPGPRPSDGVWAPHWYGAVEKSTGFGPPRKAKADLAPAHRQLAEAMGEHYEALAGQRLRPVV